MIEFEFLGPDKFDLYARDLFSILSANMSRIFETDENSEEHYDFWYSAISEAIKKDKRHIVLIIDRSSEMVVGFFQYYTTNETFMMEEIQIKSEFQRKYNIFRSLYGFLLGNINTNLKYVEAYTDKRNLKSAGILKKLGLENTGETSDGKFLHYKGTFCNLMKWYSEKHLHQN